MTDTIFVLIPSYRDRECQHTIRDLFANAANPDRVFVGVCWQVDVQNDTEYFETCDLPYTKQIRKRYYSHTDSKGANWARAEAAKLYNGETYTLVIDAHMRFIEGWDDKMIAMLPAGKSVLTGFPPNYTLPNNLEIGYVARTRPKCFEGSPYGPALPEFVSDKIPESDDPPSPTMTVSQGFMFAPSEAFREVPFDPHIYFFHDEITLAVRLWTHGWDLYAMSRALIWHHWKRSERITHWDDHKNLDAEEKRSRERAGHLLDSFISDNPAVLADLEKYGLGTERTLAEYQEFSGIDFVKKVIRTR